MHTSIIATGVVFVALLVGCSQPVSPTSPTSVPSGGFSINGSSGNTTAGISAEGVAKPAGHDVPFKGSFEGVAAITPIGTQGLSVLLKGTGNATHLGRYTVVIPHTVTLNSAGTATAIGTFTFTAANGDTLTADLNGQAGPTATPGVVSIVETGIITGGTGRFAGAGGNFRIERLFSFATSLTSGSFEGTISSPGASKL